MAGYLLAFEGLDGAGKTTQARLLATRLGELGTGVVLTKEPTDGPHGQRIRSAALSGVRLAPTEELDLFVADRAEHVRDVIRPALERGQIVITDRYFLSTVAYQGARGLEFDSLLRLNESRFPAPDLAFLLEVDAATGLQRVKSRGNGVKDAFERIDLLNDVATVFAKIERPYLARLDGRQDIEVVHALVLDAIVERIPALSRPKARSVVPA